MSSGSSPAPVNRLRTNDLTTVKYDHEITLVDSEGEQSISTPSAYKQDRSWRSLARNSTRTSLKDQLQKRKYARFSQDKYDFPSKGLEQGHNVEGENVERATPEPSITPLSLNPRSEAVDFAGQAPSTVDLQTSTAIDEQPVAIPQMIAPTRTSTTTQREGETDILYENQRGSFFCGIPLYSHSSLLNFDPAAWVTREFKDSPVNITNAQVPDPSWVWDWKSWYVDMAGDVDEQGWQYSFAFGNRWSWHGTHPWLTSFARRRRWLRRRVKRINYVVKPGTEGHIEAAHHLNNDYFTIHSRKSGRPAEILSNPEMQLARPQSYTSFTSLVNEDEKAEDITDVPSLDRALRRATVDREKIDAIKAFVKNTDDEVFYLLHKIPEIMSSFVFQNSRRQVLEFLNQAAREAQEHRDMHVGEGQPEDPVEHRRINNLLRAAEAAGQQIQGLEYWSDRKHVLRTADEKDDDDISEDDQSVQNMSADIGAIRGISEKAETAGEVRVDRRLTIQGKGKEPAKREPPDLTRKDTALSQVKHDADTIFIPD